MRCSGYEDDMTATEAFFIHDLCLNQQSVWMPAIDGSNERGAENFILYEFVGSEMAKRFHLRFDTTESWTNPSFTRSVIREVLELQRSNNS